MIIFVMSMIVIHMSLGLTFLLWLNVKCLNFKIKTNKTFRYYGFSVAIDTFLWDCR